MSLTELFEMQRGLDKHILENHPIKNGESRIAKKLLAFQVELGELANELPEIFKFWSGKENNYELALEEFVDGVHFLLGLGLDLKLDSKLVILKSSYDSTLECLRECFRRSSNLDYLLFEEKGLLKRRTEVMYSALFSAYITLGEMLGFNWSDVEKVYMEKNSINHQRQAQGY